MIFDGLETLFTDNMLNLAGILFRHCGINSQGLETAGKDLMSLLDLFCDPSAGIRKIDKSGIRHCYMFFLFQVFHGNTDT